MAKQKLTTNKDNWSGENITVSIDTEKQIFEVYGDTFMLACFARHEFERTKSGRFLEGVLRSSRCSSG